MTSWYTSQLTKYDVQDFQIHKLQLTITKMTDSLKLFVFFLGD